MYQEEVNDAEKLMKLVKDDIFNANVYVFTPNGDVFDFPPDQHQLILLIVFIPI